MPNRPKITIGENLKYIRTVYQIPAKEIAYFLGMSENNYHKIERNEIGISFINATKIAQLVKISIEVLINNNPIQLAHSFHEKGVTFVEENSIHFKNILRITPPH